MNLLQMQYFLAVAESGLLIATAEKLHISPSALSKTINRLESDLGVRLFERSNTGMVLTEAGILARDTMSEALAMLDNLCATIATASKENKQLSIISTAGLSCTDMVSAFSTAHPEISVFFKEIDLTDLKMRDMLNQYDFLLSTTNEVQGEPLCCIPLFDQRPLAMLHKNHPLARGATVSLRELSEEPFIQSPANTSWNMFIKNLFESQNLGFHPIMECSFSVRVRAVSKEMGVTLVSPMSISFSSKPDNVVLLPISDELPPHNMNINWHSGRRQSHSAQAFIRFAKTYYGIGDTV